MTMECGSGNGPLSPKKKLHVKPQNLADSVQSLRVNLKDAKDISARNLMAHCMDSSSTSSDGDSTIEEVVTIDEETEYSTERDCTDGEYVEEEIIEEEIIEESYSSDDSELEPLPPPINIPKALQVKDDDDKEEASSSDDESNEDSSEDEKPPVRQSKPVVKEQVILDKDKLRPDKVRGHSCYPEESKAPLKKEEKAMETYTEEEEEEEKEPVSPRLNHNSIRPAKYRGLSVYEEDPTAPKPKPKTTTEILAHYRSPPREAAPKTPTREATPKTSTRAPAPAPAYNPPGNSNDHPDIKWEKPDWTKNTKLRATGKSAAENLAKPITSLPHMKKGSYDDDDTEDRKPPAVSAPAVQKKPEPKPLPDPKTPKPIKPYASLHQTPEKAQAPKSAPTVRKAAPPAPPVAAATDDETLPVIAWEKPEWAKKKVLRDTSKGAKLLSGKDISRPIGGIRPVND